MRGLEAEIALFVAAAIALLEAAVRHARLGERDRLDALRRLAALER